jgi:hypothetical protein
MPPFEEVLHYIKGIRQLVLQNPAGFRWLDLTDRGLKRSFWAMVWCFPLMLPNWIWWRGLFADYGPPNADTGLFFFIRMGLIEYLLWMLPLLTVGLFMAFRGIGGSFETLVIANNWFNVPVYLLTAAISLMELFIPAPFVLWYYAVQLQLAVVIIAEFSLFFTLTKKNWPNALGMTAAAVIPSMIASVWLNNFLGISIGS